MATIRTNVHVVSIATSANVNISSGRRPTVAVTAGKHKPHHNAADAENGKKRYETCHIICRFVIKESIAEVLCIMTVRCLREVEELHQFLVGVEHSN